MTNPGIYYLFVYGSLRSGFQSTAYEYISRFFSYVGEAKVKGQLFDMGSFPAALPADDNSYITGELYKIKNEGEFSWAIGQLDDYEGVAVEPDEIQLYRREITEVYVNTQVINAWVYWYNGDVSGRPVIPSGDLMEFMASKK